MSSSKKNVKATPAVASRKSAATTAPATTPKTTTTATPARTAMMETKPGAREVSSQAVAEAAYFLWLKRGGNPTANWLEAEASLRAGVKKG